MMRKLRLSIGACVLALLCGASAFASEFNKTVSVTGGTSQRLSAVMIAAGWAGPLGLQTLTVCNPSAAANTAYLGDASTDTTSGFPVEAGSCYTLPPLPSGGAYASTNLWLYVATTQNVGLSAHAY